jgi:hypothetical protein
MVSSGYAISAGFAETMGPQTLFSRWTFSFDDDSQMKMSLPELAQSGHASRLGECPLLGEKGKSNTGGLRSPLCDLWPDRLLVSTPWLTLRCLFSVIESA